MSNIQNIIFNVINMFFHFIIRHEHISRIKKSKPINLYKLYLIDKLRIKIYKKIISSNFLINKKKLTLSKSKKMKVGFLYMITGAASFESSIFKYVPENIDLFLYDLKFENTSDKTLQKYNYRSYNIKRNKNLVSKIKNNIFLDPYDWEKISLDINKDDLDIIFISPPPIGSFTHHKILEMIQTPFILNVSAGDVPTFNNNINVHGHIQLPPSYKFINKKLYSFCKSKVIYDGPFETIFFYAKRDIDKSDFLDIQERKKIIFSHNRLSKLQNPEWLKMICEILLKHTDMNFVFMGHEKECLDPIIDFFKSKGVFHKVKYLGEFSQMNLSKDGKLVDKNWQLAKKYLRESIFMIAPFPAKGGSTRIEAYLMGLPVITLEENYYQCKNDFKTVVNMPDLLVDEAVGYNKDDIINIVESVLNGDKFLFNNIVQKQLEVAQQFTNEKLFWDNILNIIKTYSDEHSVY